MQFIGHTMATPGMGVADAARLFARLGCTGTEVICRQGQPFTPDVSDVAARAAAAGARDAGAPVITVTPYAWDINSPDPALAGAHQALLERMIDVAALMGARYVRAYGGREAAAGQDAEGAFGRAAAALRSAGAHAAGQGILILVENHPGSVTRTGAATRRLVDAVGLAAVRALYDPANVLNDTDEDWRTTLDGQKGIIAYVHAKDFRTDDAGKRRACPVGAGSVPWREILAGLRAAGWDGCPQGLAFIHQVLADSRT
jgi:sugar phosphate isomerase/epimerase